MSAPYVLTFEPILKEKVWGGRRLRGLGKPLREGSDVGESWEIADLASTSAGGGGGGEARSIIARGPLAGQTLHDALRLWGSHLLGDVSPSADGGFPLLVKFLDAREHLSVQVHPSPAYAAAHPGAHLKTECWYVLDAEPGSLIYKGVRAGVGRAEFERSLRSGQGEGVVGLLEAVPAVAGDCHTLPSGTVHALGAGVLVAEVQTPSDTTFRVYDWAKEYGRKGRELHVEQALACIDFRPAPAATRASNGRTLIRLAATEFFTIDEMAPEASHDTAPGRCAVVICVRGESRIHAVREKPVRLSAGETSLIPATISPTIATGPGSRALVVGLGAGAD